MTLPDGREPNGRERSTASLSERVYRALIRSYPEEVRRRYGDEMVRYFGDLCREELRGRGRKGLASLWARTLPELVFTALKERISMMMKQPSAFVPLAMSFAALAMVLCYVAMFGVIREADEGAVAHTWQLLVAGQAPIVAFFAIKYLPQKPKQTSLVLALQVVAVLAACAPVFFLKL